MSRILCLGLSVILGLNMALTPLTEAASNVPAAQLRSAALDVPGVGSDCASVSAYGRKLRAIWAKIGVDDPELADSNANNRLDTLNVFMFWYAMTNAEASLKLVQPPSYAMDYHRALIGLWAVYVSAANDAQNGHVSLTFALLLHARERSDAVDRLAAAKTAAAAVCPAFATAVNDFS